MKILEAKFTNYFCCVEIFEPYDYRQIICFENEYLKLYNPVFQWSTNDLYSIEILKTKFANYLY